MAGAVLARGCAAGRQGVADGERALSLTPEGLYNLPQERVEQLNEVAQQQVMQLTSGI